VAGEDHAHGDVLMTPRGRSQAYARYGEKATGRDATQFLSIRLRGSLEEKWRARSSPIGILTAAARHGRTIAGVSRATPLRALS
jgi:hypothetical protein